MKRKGEHEGEKGKTATGRQQHYYSQEPASCTGAFHGRPHWCLKAMSLCDRPVQLRFTDARCRDAEGCFHKPNARKPKQNVGCSRNCQRRSSEPSDAASNRSTFQCPFRPPQASPPLRPSSRCSTCSTRLRAQHVGASAPGRASSRRMRRRA